MTPERLAEIERKWERCKCATMIGADDILAEVRRLWAERDARLLVGHPVGEERLAEIRTMDARVRKYAGSDVDSNDIVRGDLLQHVAFLERLLADADDLPQVRRTGYRDGWKAAMAKAGRLIDCFVNSGSMGEFREQYGSNSLQQSFGTLADAGPDA